MSSANLFATVQSLLAAGRRADAVALVAREAVAGQADALHLQALWLLIGDPLPRNVPAARAALGRARAAGHAEAALLETALTANGSGAAADWPTALNLLRRLAPKSHEANALLEMVDAMDVAADGSPRRLSTPERLGDRPAVVRHPGLLTARECEAIASSVIDILAPAVVADPQTGRMMAHPVRTSDGAVIGPTRENLVIRAINLRLAAITGTDVAQGESLMVLRYGPGQQYHPHLDALPHVRNQRIKTVLIYLNDGYDGGETRFEASGLTVKGQPGDAIVFDNVLPDGSPDPLSRHAGLPVRRGTKWLATRWIRARPLDPWDPSTAA